MKCRLCQRAAMVSVLDLGLQRPSGHFPGPGDGPRQPQPLHVWRCLTCGLSQLDHVIPLVQQYTGQYGYRSGLNELMRAHLKGIAYEAVKIWQGANHWDHPQSVLDIGCNDGTLLAELDRVPRRVGIDPGPWLQECPDDITRLQGFFPEICPKEQFDIIFTIAMFYDLEEPLVAAQEIKRRLTKGGLWVCEVADWGECIRKGIWDGICHEHLTYWTESTFAQLAFDAGFSILHISRSDTNGGSIRFYCAPIGPVAHHAYHLADFDYDRFKISVRANQKLIRETLRQYRAGIVHLYGASTKANVLLQACQLGPDEIEFAAERSLEKVGHVTATGIPIISEDESRRLWPHAYLVGPWHFKSAIVRRESMTLHNGTDFIFPLPTVNVEPGHVNRLGLQCSFSLG